MGPAGRTARAKGLAERRMVLGYAMRSALTPVVSQLGIDVGPLILGFGLAAAVFVIVANILVDIAYTLLDLRLRLS
jgi:peptide/nickel transport system permease protein